MSCQVSFVAIKQVCQIPETDQRFMFSALDSYLHRNLPNIGQPRRRLESPDKFKFPYFLKMERLEDVWMLLMQDI